MMVMMTMPVPIISLTFYTHRRKNSHYNKERFVEGKEAKQKTTKTKRVFGTKPKARAGWPKRLATPLEEVGVLGVH